MLTQFSEQFATFIRLPPNTKDFQGVYKVVANTERCESQALVANTLVNTKLLLYMGERLAEHNITLFDQFSTPLYVLSHFLGSPPPENQNRFHGVNGQSYKAIVVVELDNSKLGADLGSLWAIRASASPRCPCASPVTNRPALIKIRYMSIWTIQGTGPQQNESY
ncbi:MAG: kinase/pyrophosphorylase [Acidobacteria bacterium]|nr:kinase/pyrophosphorylase [Acidobacteriota bacterium]